MRKYIMPVFGLLTLTVLLLLNGSWVTNVFNNPTGIASDTGAIVIRIDLDKEYQSIHSFGASDCWSAKFMGSWKDEHKKNAIADLLFSTEQQADGSPKGIGLSMWRFNIGAGSYEQGTASGIADDYRREECFLTKDGKYDWTKQAGAQWFLKAAKKRGVKYLLGFTNSAPVQFTQNGLASGLANNNLNLREDKYNAFAVFLATVCKHFASAGLALDYISPVNEPQWKWGEHPNQEGSGATNAQTAKLIKIAGPTFKAAGLAAKLTVGEAGQVNFLYQSGGKSFDNQLPDFFGRSSANYLGDMPNTAKLISYHSYFSTCPDSALTSSRKAVDEKRNQVDPAVELWQSEFGILGDICSTLNGSPRNTGIGYGLYVAKVIHADLAIAGVSSFQWWLAINPYNYSDGLVYINAPDGSMDPVKSKEDGLVSSSKQLWCMGNYSRFIRPGMKRVEAGLVDAAMANNDILVSSYKNSAGKDLVTVVINSSPNTAVIQLRANRTINARVDSYTTSANDNMKHAIAADGYAKLPPESVTTFVTKYE